ncbi:hypothetical protein BX666DRAFT_1869655 [Dichotomocladium elegans]|nr:hypothetical protein BX666DRAFT_1869655 [Dichotomocladium elegans]
MAYHQPGCFENTNDHTSVHEDDEYRAAARSSEFEHPIEDPIDLDMFRDNGIIPHAVNPKHIVANKLGPREQEEADERIREGMRDLFDNRFMKAKGIFQSKASLSNGIYKRQTRQELDIKTAMDALGASYTIASAQIDNSMFRSPLKSSLSQYLSTIWTHNKSGLPPSPAPVRQNGLLDSVRKDPVFLPNGILRANVIKAESCLLMGILQLSQETVVCYIKCGINLRRAYKSYSIVWREYKRMGQNYTKYMDRDTVSAIQFGIGAVHLILASMPMKIHKIFTSLGWEGDKQLGFALLKLCIESRGIRAPLASLTLLSYYSILPSFASQIYAKELMGPAIECLLDAQKCHPSSCFFLYFAARIARIARNLPLSTQSLAFAAESCRGEWAETAMRSIVDYETGFNLALQLDWDGAAKYFEQLGHDQNYWSRSFIRYFEGACRGMLGQRTDCILRMAEVAQMAKEDANRRQQLPQQYHQHPHREHSSFSFIDAYVQRKVALYQKSGYQEIELCLPALEILLLWNAFDQMQDNALKQCLASVQKTLELVYEREKTEHMIRMRELVPTTKPPDYYNYRAVLLLIKASLMNALGRYSDGIAHLNWIIDHQDRLTTEAWLLPFTYWEAGVTSWGMGNIKKSRALWQHALTFRKYDFEYRMAVRLSLALAKCDELGIQATEVINHGRDSVKLSTHMRKRMPIIHH